MDAARHLTRSEEACTHARTHHTLHALTHTHTRARTTLHARTHARTHDTLHALTHTYTRARTHTLHARTHITPYRSCLVEDVDRSGQLVGIEPLAVRDAKQVPHRIVGDVVSPFPLVDFVRCL